MKKTSFFDKFFVLVGLVVCGCICTIAAVQFGGMDLLLAGIVITLFCDGILTIWRRRKWIGLFVHLFWAGIFLAMVYQTRELVVDTDCWQWYLLWGILAFRLLILQPIYLINIKKRVVKNAS